MPTANEDEGQLISRAISGDVDAFGELYTLHQDAIYRYVYFRLADSKDAEDLTEQTFLNAWEAVADYDDLGKPFASWLYRIAHNLVIDFYRQNKKKSYLFNEVQENSIYQSEKSALQHVIENEEIEFLARAIAQLTEDQQQVVILRFVEGLSHSEVAEILEKNEGACRMIQYRALSALHQIMKRDLE
jgi:RNA polymerase sigma-70 factor (ECF subfamily)